MFCHGRVRFLAAALLIGAAACSSSTPTSPSPTSSDAPGPQNAGEGGDASTQDNVPSVLGATKFMAFGDSISFGVESSFDEIAEDLSMAAAFAPCPIEPPPPANYPAMLASMLSGAYPAQAPGITLINCGIGGETTATGVQRLGEKLAQYRPQGLLLLEGINDLNGGRSIGETVNNLRTMIEIAQAYNTTVLIATMFQTYRAEQPLPDGGVRVRENSWQQVPAFNQAIVQMAQGRPNVHIVDVNQAFGNNRSFVGNDGLHPTAAGYDRMAGRFHGAIATVWSVRRGFQ